MLRALRRPPRVPLHPWRWFSPLSAPEDRDAPLVNIRRALVGNTLVFAAKLGAFAVSLSPAILSEVVHSAVDTGNQWLLLRGLLASRRPPDVRHPFGYGRSAFYYSLLSACSVLFVGAGVTVWHAVDNLLFAPVAPLAPYGLAGWSVMGLSFSVDLVVLLGAFRDLNAQRPAGVSLLRHFRAQTDPFLLILEDVAATGGVLIALAGMGLAHLTGNPVYDHLACLSVGLLLGGVGISLMRMNKAFLVGKSLEPAEEDAVKQLLLRDFPSCQGVSHIKSRWESPSTFAFQCQVDFDGGALSDAVMRRAGARHVATVVAAASPEQREEALRALMRTFGEELMCELEEEVGRICKHVRTVYPKAVGVEIIPRIMPREKPGVVGKQT